MIRLLYIAFFITSFSWGQSLVDLQLLAQQQGGGTTPLYTFANAANPTETDATTGFTELTTVSFTSSATAPQNGSYSIVMEHTGLNNTSCRGTTTFDAVNGATYEVSVYLKEIVGNNWQFFLYDAEGWVTTQSTSVTAAGTWVEYTLTGTTNSTTPVIRFVGTSSADTGDQLGIDNIRITQL